MLIIKTLGNDKMKQNKKLEQCLKQTRITTTVIYNLISTRLTRIIDCFLIISQIKINQFQTLFFVH